MNGCRTQLANPAQTGDERWEGWLDELGRALSSGDSRVASGAPGATQDDDGIRLERCELRGDPQAARTARRFTRATVREWGLDGLADDAELVIGELVINALRHGLSSRAAAPAAHPVRVVLAHTGESLICVVTDPSDRSPTPRPPDADSEGGRGLQVVAGVSHRWGWAPGHPGKAVWAGFTLPRGTARPARHLEICR
ncbi:ATP-binding protein [Sphaerisporangium sp. NPDC004334]